MDVLDYNAPASLTLRSKSSGVSVETGPVADLVKRTIDLNRDPACTVVLELDGRALGYGLIEAIYQRPDFPRPSTGWRPEKKRPAPLGATILAKVAQATGLGTRSGKSKIVVLLVEDEPLVRMLG